MHNDKDQLLFLSVKPSDNILYANRRDEVYLRVGDETHKVTYEERKNLEYDRGIRAFESQIVDDALLEDLDSEMVDQYKQTYGFSNENLWDLLFPKGLAKRLRIDGRIEYRLTVAGILLLARTPTTFVPGARIRFIRYEGREAKVGTEMNVVKQRWIEGPLTKMISQAEEVLDEQLRTFSSLNEKSGKFDDVPEYPKGAWLEGIVNAVTHRSYNYTGDDIRVIMFDDHLVIHSPGALPTLVTPENIRNTHYSRNPYIARALTDLGRVKELGEGVDRIYIDMNRFFLDDPIYKVASNSVELILKNNIVTRAFRKDIDLASRLGGEWQALSFVEKRAVSIAYERQTVKTKELQVATEVGVTTARTALRHLVEMEILEKVATSKTAPSQYYRLIK